MSKKLQTLSRHLRRGEVLRFPRRGRLCLRVDSGSLWITIDGELQDIQLDAGQSRVFESASAVLVSSLGGDTLFSEVGLHVERGAAAWRRRLQAWLHGAPRPAFFA